MSARELAELVERMRAMQKRFFGGEKSGEVVGKAKHLERQVDTAVHDILHPPPPSLFDQPAEGER